MSIVVNGTTIPYYIANALMLDGVSVTKVLVGATVVWEQLLVTDFPWSARSYSTCADQAAGLVVTFTNERKWFIAPAPVNISNGGLLWQSSVTNDANNICVTQFIFSFLGYTYNVVNQTKNKYVQRKVNGASDASYVTISPGAQIYNGYTYLTINIGWTSSVYIGTGGVLDMSRLDGMVVADTDKYLSPMYYHAQNYHYAGCTSAYLYALVFS